MKIKKVIILILFLSAVYLYADFIVPRTDPVYEFLEMTHTLKRTNLNHLNYPLYYNDIMETLTELTNTRVTERVSRQAYFHLRRLSMDYNNGTDIAVWPARKTLTSIGEMFRKDPQHRRLATFFGEPVSADTEDNLSSTDGASLFVSGILGYNYDKRYINNDPVFRVRRYYGIETAGNFAQNFGFYFSFRKGHYIGNSGFIREEKFISKMDSGLFQDDGRYYRVDLLSEVDFKNRFLNLSMGYGSFDIGRSLASSIILNSDVTPYGYIKFNKRFGAFEYNGITTQLTPNMELYHQGLEPLNSKSMAIQTISYHHPVVNFGLGNSIIYANRTLDLAYSTPLSIYVIMDNKNHGVDNTLAFAYGEVRPFSGLNLFGNIIFDDVTKSRFSTPEYLSYSAVQGGIITQLPNFPVELGGEVTVVGPSMYSHKKGLTYMQDEMMLGFRHGSNLVSFLCRLRFHFTRVSFGIMYENVQQGDLGSHPNDGGGEFKLLANDISRKEFVGANVDLRLIPELHLFARYQFSKFQDRELHYIFTGAEFRY